MLNEISWQNRWYQNCWEFSSKYYTFWDKCKEGNEVSTRHDMNYGQISYPTLVVKLINFTKAELLSGLAKSPP